MPEQSQLEITLSQMTQLIHLADGQSIFEYAIIVFITFMIGKVISSFAKGFFTRTIATLFGLSLVSDSFRIAGFTITSGLILGIGFLTPHFMYYFNYLLITVFKVQRFTINTYYIFITFWYKIRRFFAWIGSFFVRKKKSGFGTDDRSNYQDRSSSNSYNSYNQQSSSSNREEEYQEYTRDEYKQEEQKQQSQQQQRQSSTHSSYEDTSSSSSANALEDKLKKDSRDAQFFSSSYSIVLGVDSSMSFKEIKKAYRKLVSKYHPDLNPDNEVVCTLITQRLNMVYEYFQKQEN